MTLSNNLAGNHFSASYKASDFCWQTILYFLEHLRVSHIFYNVCCYSKAVFVIPKGPGPAGMTKVQYLTPVQRSWVDSWCWGGKGNWPEEEMRCSEKEKRCGLVIVQTACSLFLSPKWWFLDLPAPTSWHILQYIFFLPFHRFQLLKIISNIISRIAPSTFNIIKFAQPFTLGMSCHWNGNNIDKWQRLC